MKFAVINVPAAPVRKKAFHQKEMVNQLLFGETVKILKIKKGLWAKVSSLHDGYEGWITINMLDAIDEIVAHEKSLYVTTNLLSAVSIKDKTVNVPVGSSLPFFKKEKGAAQAGKGKLGNKEFRFTGKYCKTDDQQAGPELIKKLTNAWLNAPYLWGGRTPLGVDCSGFVQVIYKLMGIDLPRDARQQAQKGKEVKKLSEIKPGDLAFFNQKEKIVHVGILLGNDQIIHSSGNVRIDTIDKKGIINVTTGKRTHLLRSIKRYW
jgi:cell wall-associated NlpC family hydrolase